MQIDAIQPSQYEVVVVGAGPAGCAAALAARQAGAEVLLIDMAAGPGGALAAMGLAPGHDSALAEAGVLRRYCTTLLEVADGPRLRMLSPRSIERARAGALVLATGGREQTRGNLALPGTRPAGVMTAGAALRLLARSMLPAGRQVLVAGMGRWADPVARALERAGASIVGCVPSIAQIEGWPRITSVLMQDGRRQECDLLVLATPLLAWLAPALAGAAQLPGVFVAGSAVQGELEAPAAAVSGAAAGRRAAAWVRAEGLGG